MPESLLTILKFLLLALLYLFFLRVLRAVWAEVSHGRGGTSGGHSAGGGTGSDRDRSERGGGSATTISANPLAKGTPAKLRVLEPAEHRGKAYALADEMTVGRAAGCQVRIDDGYASQLHARLFRRDNQLYVEDLGSTNGTYVSRKGTSGKEKVSGPFVLRTGDRLCVGRTVLEVTR